MEYFYVKPDKVLEVDNNEVNKISLDDEKCDKVMTLIEALNDIDDVSDVYHNLDV